MSLSPPVRRLSYKREEDLINAYEAEEERIINVLSRKLEKLQEEKIELENVLEAESESHVNRLSRELSALRLAQQLATQQNGGSPGAGVNGDGTQSPTLLPSEDMLEAMRRENEQLRNRLVDTEREFIRISRLNEIYREELIQHRRRVRSTLSFGTPRGQPHRSVGARPVFPAHAPSGRRRARPRPRRPSVLPIGVAHAVRTSPSVAIPRPPSQIHRPPTNVVSGSTTPLSHSPSSASDSPYLSPSLSTQPASFATAATTPPSSSAPRVLSAAALVAAPPQPLSYPSVPPPSLSSSYAGPDSPVEPRGSRWRHGSIHDLRQASRSASRHRSVERGARVAETGQLVPRSRAGSIVPGANNVPPPAAPSPEVGLPMSS
ncbi:hypothetical protein EDB83DRAFT_2508094 [Lactarius deliciosus]|nr:hypothetical protein EDB83DRAFT_2508094 [Lactarius deliciosus]